MQPEKIEPGRLEPTKPWLRPDQEGLIEHEIQGIESQLNGPAFVRNRLEDRAGQTQRLRKLRGQLESQQPRAYEERQVDTAVKREAELREKIAAGMPTDREQRHNPAGNVDRHMGWERRNKRDVLEWKNIRRRLVKGGQLQDGRDVANVETLRPRPGSAQEGNLDNCAIPVKTISMPAGGPKVVNGLSDEAADEIKAQMRALQAEIDRLKAERKTRKPMSEERKAQARANLAKAREARAAKSED